MRKRLYYASVIAILLIIFTTSCKKSVENKIDGKWRRINVVNASADVFEDWEFSNGYFTVFQYSLNGSTIDTMDYNTGEYTIKTKLFKRILSITKVNKPTNTNYTNYICDWTIEKLTKKYLTIVTTTYGGIPGGQELREFIKN
jgi:hypothetical protein